LGNKKMNIDKSKSKLSTITLILLLTISATLIALPTATAQNSLETYAYLNAVPNPVGVNQEVLLHFGITRTLVLAPHGYEGLTVTVRKPDGTNDTIGPLRTDSTGGSGWIYVPTQQGTYYLQTNFPAQWYNFTGVDGGGQSVSFENYYEASSSEELELVVQGDPVPDYPGIPLPNEYWTRPIDSQAREWATIAGSWLDGSRRRPRYAPYNEGPETAHILWAKPLTIGGLVGGALDDMLGLNEHGFEIGDAYEGKFCSRFIIAGRLYYNKYAGPSVGPVDIYREYACVDLHTGEELWSKVFMDNLTLAFGQLMYWDTYDYHGVYAYLWATEGNTWHAFNAFTGDWVYTLEGVPSGTRVYGPKGEILIYTVNTGNAWMTLWNSTNIPELYGNQDYGSMGWGQWRPYGKTVNAASGYMWNKTIPTGLPGSVQWVYPVDRLIGHSGPFARPYPLTPAITEITSWSIDLSPGQEGQLLFNKTWQTPASWAAGNQTIVFEAISPESTDGVFVIGARDNRQHYGFSTENGEFLWETDPEIYLNWFGTGGIGGERPPLIAYGKMVTSGIGGIVYAYDIKTGKREWTYEASDPYNEILWNNNWWLYPVFITDGKIYYGHTEHSPIDPKPRGGAFIALDIETGDVVWRANGLFRQCLWGGLGIIGDSIIATMDTYDQRIYAIGKGASATTVTAAPKVVSKETSVMIEGTVMDVSPGTKDAALQIRFPNGLPAISDDDMSEWMLYVYKQFARPDATGVPVTLDVVDANGQWTSIGTVTTDSSGMFHMKWTPETEGEYTIVATFMGSGGYYASYAQTVIGVGPAAAEYQEAEAAPDYTPMFTGILVAVAIAIIIGLVNLFALRKQK